MIPQHPENRATTTHRKRKPQAKAKAWHAKFLRILRDTGNVRLACAAARINRTAAYHAREQDPTLAAQWDEAIEDACDLLETEAWRRAVYGTTKPVFWRGQMVVDAAGNPSGVQEYSDTLLVLLLKAHRPKKYRENISMEQSGPGGKPIEVRDATNLTDTDLEIIAAGGSIGVAGKATGAPRSD